MSSPRNKVAYEQSRAARQEIRRILLDHPPTVFASPLTAKRIRPLLSRDLSERTIQWHLQAIRAEHAANTLRSPQFNHETG